MRRKWRNKISEPILVISGFLNLRHVYVFLNLFFSLIKGKFYLTNPTEKRSRQILEKLTAPQMTLTPYAISQRSYLDKFNAQDTEF